MLDVISNQSLDMASLVAAAILAVAILVAVTSRWLVTGRLWHAHAGRLYTPEKPSAYATATKDTAKRKESWKPAIEPLPDFDWRATPPLKLRPIKPTYNITMAIQNSTPSDLIVMDRNYLDRVTARRRVMADHPATVMGAIPSGHAPVRELYAYLLGTYLPARYPGVFELVGHVRGEKEGDDDGGGESPQASPTLLFRNKVTGLTAPLRPPPADPLEALRILGETVEDDLFLLLRDERGEEAGEAGEAGEALAAQEHRAVAFVCCHPSGFDPATKLGRRLVEIHGPVPAYEKIGASMERYFARLEVGRSVKRMNWSIQTHPDLFAPSGNHVHAGEAVEEETHVDPAVARFRVELQTLTRLPDTGAILFSFKTFLYPLDEICAEGLGPQLADAVEGLKAGNAPGMWTYKGGVRWGRAVCAYLREGEGRGR